MVLKSRNGIFPYFLTQQKSKDLHLFIIKQTDLNNPDTPSHSITAIDPSPGTVFRLIASSSTVLDDGSKASKEGLLTAGRSRSLVAEFAIPKLGLSISHELFSDKSIVCVAAGPFVFGMWQRTKSECNPQMFPKATPFSQPGSIAFIEAHIHYADVIERIIKGRIDRAFTPRLQAPYTDDVDKKIGWFGALIDYHRYSTIPGLHDYHLVLAFTSATSTMFSHKFDLFRAKNESEITSHCRPVFHEQSILC